MLAFLIAYKYWIRNEGKVWFGHSKGTNITITEYTKKDGVNQTLLINDCINTAALYWAENDYTVNITTLNRDTGYYCDDFYCILTHDDTIPKTSHLLLKEYKYSVSKLYHYYWYCIGTSVIKPTPKPTPEPTPEPTLCRPLAESLKIITSPRQHTIMALIPYINFLFE